MGDTTGDALSEGTIALSVWSLVNMRWGALQALSKTSAAEVMKDSDENRGKLICESGVIVEIHGTKLPQGKLYEGVLALNEGRYIRYAAVGSTGALVDQSSTRFCGVATGTSSYANSGGGTTHSIVAVGMFDLPQNKAAAKVEHGTALPPGSGKALCPCFPESCPDPSDPVTHGCALCDCE